ncbi:hypothetical protein P0136_10175 [Lentisphaerota bacterium ZTH]|nr:hypothetical protein JYG24_12315 [Lentisphaerota bacterium]WET05727.1 hypothetical protein P0136_10175 [Lentisphaerota bacterium ZTH]
MTKENWVAMFKEIGLTEDQMNNWHCIFEKQYPDDHKEFLKWLGIDDNEITKIKQL